MYALQGHVFEDRVLLISKIVDFADLIIVSIVQLEGVVPMVPDNLVNINSVEAREGCH